MAKRKASGKTAHALPRPRKKQAVTKTNSGKTKTLIRQNATNSPLLSLPSEVRENILVNLIGNNLIHVKHLEQYDLAEAKGISWYDLHNADPEFAKKGAFRHAICVATQSEQGVYDETLSSNARTPEGEDLYYSIASCRKRHEGCKMTQGGSKKLLPEEHGALTLDLKVLGACRQLYEEANHLLWASNTFSFDDASSLNKFLASLNPAQKRNMAGIHISAKLDRWEPTRWGSQAWSVPLKMSYINMLRGVQNLHLCFQHCYASATHPLQTFEQSYELCKKGLDEHIKPFLRLRALNTTNITVVLSDDLNREVDKQDQALYRWSTAVKNQYAEHIRVQLLAPNGAELVNKDAEIANAASEIALSKKAKRSATFAKAKVESAKDTIKQCTARAERADEQAGKNAARAAEISGKGKKALSKMAKFHDAADIQQRVAKGWRANAKKMGGNLIYLHRKAVEAVAKYKRAKDRVEARKVKNGLQTGDDKSESSEDSYQMEMLDPISGEGDDDDSDDNNLHLRVAAWDGLLSEEEEPSSDDWRMSHDDEEEGLPEQRHMTGADKEARATTRTNGMDDESS